MNRQLYDSLTLAVHEAVNTPGGTSRVPVSGPAHLQGAMVGFVAGFLSNDNGDAILELQFLENPIEKPKKPRGPPRRDGLRVARSLMFWVYTTYYEKGKGEALRAIARALGPNDQKEVKDFLKQERTSEILGGGFCIGGETIAEGGARTPFVVWFDQSASTQHADQEAVITGPSWLWREGMRAAEYAPRTLRIAMSPDRWRSWASYIHQGLGHVEGGG